jgi:drug/metabolite transporter (DMT)-like permease
VAGSLLAYSAYMYLVAHTSPALATSYAYVNPLVAVLLGVGFGGEHLGGLGWVALVVILAGVVLVIWPSQRSPVAGSLVAGNPGTGSGGTGEEAGGKAP